MNKFLYKVAQDLIERFGTDLRNVTVVFPGKRAQMFMDQYLVDISGGPLWAPRYTTIDRLFLQFSELTPAEPIRSITILYNAYARYVKSPMTLDEFWGWGEILLRDFEDIDKHLVETKGIFANIKDIEVIENENYLTEQQIEVLKTFFEDFSPEKNTQIRERFIDLWQQMPNIYDELRQQLLTQGKMYPAGIYRQVAERLSHETPELPEPQHYAFVGFNILDTVEEKLFHALERTGKALFYWDYDEWYLNDENNEAGLFLRHNLRTLQLPNDLPDNSCNNMKAVGKQLKFIATSTDNAMARYVNRWTRENYISQTPYECAVVLCDESIMRPVLHSIPDVDCNITMGYPLTDTPVFSYISALIDLQLEGYDRTHGQFRFTHTERLMHHPLYDSYPYQNVPLSHCESLTELLAWLTECMESLGRYYALQPNQNDSYTQLYMESTYLIYKQLNILSTLVTEGVLPDNGGQGISPNMLRRIMMQILTRLSVPFHGEMSKSMQVMGLLETRNIDFRNILVLSAGEGFLPRGADEVSLIPYCLRKHFGLSTIERQTSVFAYYFYRLLQRAENVTVMFNENSSGTTQREESRFLRQLLAESSLKIETVRLSAELHLGRKELVEEIEKTPEVMSLLYGKFECNTPPLTNEQGEEGHKSRLTPSAINKYISCPIRFFYESVCNILDYEDDENVIDNRVLGNIFHESAEQIYKELAARQGGEITRDMLSTLLQNKGEALFRFIDERIAKGNAGGGIKVIAREVVHHYLCQLLHDDLAITPFTIVGTEIDCAEEHSVALPQGGEVCVKIGGRIDRLDKVTLDGRQTLRVLDYKTGRSEKKAKLIEDIFGGEHPYYLQAILYSIVLSHQNDLPVAPELYNVREAVSERDAYNPYLTVAEEMLTDVNKISEEYMLELNKVITNIFDPSQPFTRTSDPKKCNTCPLNRLCVR